MSESAVSNVVAFLFGGMVFLLVFTRLGGPWTIAFAGAILVGYVLIEMVAELRRQHRTRLDRRIAYRRLTDPVTTRNGKPSSGD